MWRRFQWSNVRSCCSGSQVIDASHQAAVVEMGCFFLDVLMEKMVVSSINKWEFQGKWMGFSGLNGFHGDFMET